MRKQLIPAQETSGRFDPFRLLDAQERQRHLDAYRSHLEARNGEIDLTARTLTRREAFMNELDKESIAAPHLIDQAGMREHMLGPGRAEIDEATAWLVAVAKANEGEAYGVDLELRRFVRGKRFLRNEQAVEDDECGTDLVQLYVFLEELYHSRILCEVCKACGFDLEIAQPPWRIRLLTRAIYHMPERVRWTLILCGEIVGVTAFKLFVDRVHLFASEPAVYQRLHALVTQIWRDELLHIAMLRARLGPLTLRVARVLLPHVVKSLIRDVPELLLLGGDTGEFMRRVRAGIEIPRDITWLEPDFTGGS